MGLGVKEKFFPLLCSLLPITKDESSKTLRRKVGVGLGPVYHELLASCGAGRDNVLLQRLKKLKLSVTDGKVVDSEGCYLLPVEAWEFAVDCACLTIGIDSPPETIMLCIRGVFISGGKKLGALPLAVVRERMRELREGANYSGGDHVAHLEATLSSSFKELSSVSKGILLNFVPLRVRCLPSDLDV